MSIKINHGKEEKTRLPILKIGLVFLLILFVGVIFALYSGKVEPKEDPGTLEKKLPIRSPEGRKNIQELEDALGFDVERGLFVKSYGPTMVTAFVDGLNSPYWEVRETTLRFLAEAVKQYDIPGSVVSRNILPKIEVIQRTLEPSTSAEDIHIVRLARRVSWQAKVKETGDPKQRLELLRDSLEDRTDGYYYPFEAMDHLVEIGTDEAKAVLEEKLAQSQQRSISEKLLERLRISIEKINLFQRLTALPPAAQIEELENVLAQYKRERSIFRNEFKIWLIRAVAKIEVPESNELLRHIWQDETYDTTLRYESQEALVQSGVITPGERTVTFLSNF